MNPPSPLPNPTAGNALAYAKNALKQSAIPSWALDAELLLMHILGIPREMLHLRPERALTQKEIAEYKKLVYRRLQREPVAYLTGEKYFWDCRFRVTPETLTPRPETETLVETAIALCKATPPRKIVDLGTGTGCLLITLLREFPSSHGVGVDVSPGALAVARANAESAGVNARAEFIESDWTEQLQHSFDLVVSNPPYIPEADIDGLEPEVARHEPRLALSGGADGLAPYRRIAAGLPRILTPQGLTLFEIGAGQSPSVTQILTTAGYTVAGQFNDLAGIPRCLAFRTP